MTKELVMSSQRILVIDDDTQILNVLKGFLTHMGYEAIVTDSWEEGIRLFEKEEFSLIILDVHMPGRDGFQVARELKTKNTDQKIVIITGLQAGEVYKKLKATEVDFNAILYKPFTAQKMEEVLADLLKRA